MKSAVVLILSIVLFCIGLSEAVKCYQCVGSNQNCKEGECMGNWCYKTMGEVAGKSVVNKGCQLTGSNACSSGSVSGAASGATCSCNSDWCNGSMSNGNIALTVLILAAGTAVAVREVFE